MAEQIWHKNRAEVAKAEQNEHSQDGISLNREEF